MKMIGLKALLPEDGKIDYLILGTFPGQKTLEVREKYSYEAYYMNGNNCF